MAKKDKDKEEDIENSPLNQPQTMKVGEAAKQVTDMINKFPHWLFFACNLETGGMALNGDSRQTGVYILHIMKSNKAMGESLSKTFSAILEDYRAHINKTSKNVN